MFLVYILLGYLIGQIVPFEGPRIDRAVMVAKYTVHLLHQLTLLYLLLALLAAITLQPALRLRPTI